MLNRILRSLVLGRFLSIDLSTVEKSVAREALEKKYAPALNRAFWFGLMALPSVLLLETHTVTSVLIPVTIVSGTAWFAVSLASMRKKFAQFGLELTTDLFTSFVLSLFVLFLLGVASLTQPLWNSLILGLPYLLLWQMGAALLGSVVLGLILWLVMVGSLKYDMNDAMLTGQNEAAEKFYKRALSLLHTTAAELRQGRSIQVANYLIGVSFFEVFMHVRRVTEDDQYETQIALANELVFSPSMPQKEADGKARELINSFLQSCCVHEESKKQKPYRAIVDEFECLKNNKQENQAMIDMRLSIIFEEMADLIEEFGENLFK